MLLSFYFLMAGVLASVVFLLYWVISLKSIKELNKLSPFECGFSSWENSRQSFSLQFFMISLIFLIFDVELLILFPSMLLIKIFFSSFSFFCLFSFFLFMSGGLFMEWLSMKLDWTFFSSI